MGISTIVTQTMLFIAVVGIASGLIVGIKGFTDKTESTFNSQSKAYNEQLKTNINIEVVHYDNSTNVTFVYVKNTGRTKIDPEKVDIWIDGIRFARNATGRNITVESDTDLINRNIWDSKEVVKIEAPRDLNPDETHNVVVMTPNSIKDTELFSI